MNETMTPPMLNTYEGSHPQKLNEEMVKLHLSKDSVMLALLIASVLLNLAQVATLMFLIFKQ